MEVWFRWSDSPFSMWFHFTGLFHVQAMVFFFCEMASLHSALQEEKKRQKTYRVQLHEILEDNLPMPAGWVVWTFALAGTGILQKAL